MSASFAPKKNATRSYRCHACDNVVAGALYESIQTRTVVITECPVCRQVANWHCEFPDVPESWDRLPPYPLDGRTVMHLPDDVEGLFREQRVCLANGCYTTSVLAGRKILMNAAVEFGAKEGEKFVFYVNFLETKHLVPPGSKEWVDLIRQWGNASTHKIPSRTATEARQMLVFVQHLLETLFERPELLKVASKP